MSGENPRVELAFHRESAVQFRGHMPHQVTFLLDRRHVSVLEANVASGPLTARVHRGASGPKDDDIRPKSEHVAVPSLKPTPKANIKMMHACP